MLIIKEKAGVGGGGRGGAKIPWRLCPLGRDYFAKRVLTLTVQESDCALEDEGC